MREHELTGVAMGDCVPPIYVFWDVTGRCNLRCLHCRELSTPSAHELTQREGMTFVDDLADLGVEFLGLLGGEPLLRDDLTDIIHHAKRRMAVGLGTNGTLVTDQVARNLKEAELDICFVSLEGPEGVNDSIRGRGAYLQALTGIQHLKREGIPVGIRMTLMRHNLTVWQFVIDLAIELECELSIRRVLPCGRAKSTPIQITRDEYRDTFNRILTYARSRELKIDSLKSTGRIMLRNRDPVTFVLSGIAEEVERRYGTPDIIAGCAAGIANAYVDSLGNVYACASLSILAGNIREQPFSQLWNNSEIFHVLRDRENLKGRCGRCRLKFICGGCRASAFLATGDFMETDPFCMLDADSSEEAMTHQ